MKLNKLLTGMIMAASMFTADAKLINNYLDETGFPLLVPSVQKLDRLPGQFSLPKEMKVSAPSSADKEVTLLGNAIKRRFGGWSAMAGTPAQCQFILTDQGVPDNQEGYVLDVTPQGIVIKAGTSTGLYYGVHTLIQLITNNITVNIPCCHIEDWPDLEVRGIFLDVRHLKDSEIPGFCDALAMLGSLKLNTIELDFGGTLPFKNSPFTLAKAPKTMDSLKMLMQAAQDNHIEIVPHLQTITHDQWLNTHPLYQSRISATLPTPGYNSTWNHCTCPAEPLSRELTDFAIRETIKLMKPRYFHLCMDEFELCNWKDCIHCHQKHTVPQMVELATHYVNLVKSLGVIPVIYQDAMSPARSNNSTLALPLRDAMPKDAVISFWNYVIHPNEVQFKSFADFSERVGVSFCNTLPNTMTMPQMIKRLGGKGTILTYWGWIGKFFLDNTANNCNAAASTAINAEYNWHCVQTPTLSQLDWDPAFETRRRLPLGCPERRPGSQYAPLSIAAVCNASLGKDNVFPRFTAQQARSIVREGVQAPEGYQLLETSDHNLAAMILTGGEDSYAAKPVVIHVNASMHGLSLLMTTGLPANPAAFGYRFSHFMPTLATMAVHYANGKTHQTDIRYRLHVNNWNSLSSGAESRFVLRGNDADKHNYSFYAFDWNNPLPEEKIASLEFIPKGKDGVPLALFAISAWLPGGPLPPAGQLDEDALYKSTIAEQQLPAPILLTDFENGMEKCRVKTEGVFGDQKPSFRIVNNPTAPVLDQRFLNSSKVLEITIPPQAPNAQGRARAILDIQVPAETPLRTLFADYQLDQPDKNVHNGFYRTNDTMSKYEVCYGIIKTKNQDWTRCIVPENTLQFEGKNPPLTPQEYRTVRFSIWFDGYDQTITLRIARVGYYDVCAKWIQDLESEPID